MGLSREAQDYSAEDLDAIIVFFLIFLTVFFFINCFIIVGGRHA